MDSGGPVLVTQPALPPLAELMPLLEEIWGRRYLSNNGPILRRLETALGEYLGVEHLSLVANATLGLVLALRGLRDGDEVITTPFSFVASAHAIKWTRARPVFADIDAVTLNIDPQSVSRLITPRTRAILGVHCFGRPCDVGRLDEIARQHDLRLIFDAAHAFGVRLNGESILEHGDLSVLSFHATKVFSTVEGGAIISRDRQTKLALDRLANFGIVDETSVEAVGLNAKMSELHAAFGLTLLRHVPEIILQRQRVARRYLRGLGDIASVRCVCGEYEGHNYYAFPILIGENCPVSRDDLYMRLKDQGILARRYFYPLLADLATYQGERTHQADDLPVARDAASRVLCLPLYAHLPPLAQDRIITIVRKLLGH